MEISRFQKLFDGWLSGTATPEEEMELMELLADPKLEQERLRLAEDAYDNLAETHLMSERQGDNIFDQIIAKPAVIHRVHFIRRYKWAAAAIFIIVASTTFFLLNHKEQPAGIVAKTQQDVKAPETNKATITLPNGETIMLDTVPNGRLIAGIARKTADGQLVFEGNASAIAYIGTTNPRNSKAMHITLPDHTEVWLNADTYLQYPTNYNAKDRLVTLKGEAYFEVKHNEAKPFRVFAGEQTIEDVGTSFNVKAYQDEAQEVQTTLLEGVVKINNAVSLKPGQQYSKNKITNANTEEVMAWKNGSFYLDGRELGTVASELGRWYDVEVVFENPNAKHSIVFGGEMGRDLTLNQAISVLEKLNVKCRLENKKLIVE
jgi:transmembrane sensor